MNAIVAALSLAVDLFDRHAQRQFQTASEVVRFVQASLEYLKTSRPTAVNLFDAAAILENFIEENPF